MTDSLNLNLKADKVHEMSNDFHLDLIALFNLMQEDFLKAVEEYSDKEFTEKEIEDHIGGLI